MSVSFPGRPDVRLSRKGTPVLQCCCSVVAVLLQCVAVRYRGRTDVGVSCKGTPFMWCSVVAVCCGVVAVCVLRCVAVRRHGRPDDRLSGRGAPFVCCSVCCGVRFGSLQCVTLEDLTFACQLLCVPVLLQCVAVCCSVRVVVSCCTPS